MAIGSPRPRNLTPLTPDPLWFKSAIIYEIPIRAFADSNADGIGDIGGVISKLDYLQELGITAIWLLPFYPSPLRDGGYDISDYTSVHAMYGTLTDFKRLLKEAHQRGIRIITELVINHTSKDHPWFQRARRSPKGSRWRNFYVWSDDDTRYPDARVIFRDFEASNWTWDPVAAAFYWHRFYSHQPDLNFDNPAVHEAVLDALDFWLELGVDGLRLDAVPYLYEREGTNCENLPETHAFLKKLRRHVDERYRDRMLLAEANQWPEDAAAYFGNGDECHMNFHFPLMPRMFMAVQLEDRFPIVDILQQTPTIPEGCQWATFLRNHDELTLEMVTDEERDYMYRVYAHDPSARLNLGIRRRLAPLLGMRQKVELMNGLLFSLPGTPVIYYGDEIGMGDNIYLGDRDGVRTPMQWSADRNAGFSQANPQKLHLPVITDPEYRFEAINVQSQQNNPASLLWWMKRTIALRREHPALGRGALELLSPDNAKVLAFLRLAEEEIVLVIANLSRFHQWVELDLSRYEGSTPIEMSGVVRFPKIGREPYRLSLAPFGFLWFTLELGTTPTMEEQPIVHLSVEASWTELLSGPASRAFQKALAAWLRRRRWFRGKSKTWRAHSISDVLFLKGQPEQGLLMFSVDFVDGHPETYFIPLTLVMGDEATDVRYRHGEAVIVQVEGLAQPAVIVDSIARGKGGSVLLEMMRSKLVARGLGTVRGFAESSLRRLRDSDVPPPKSMEFEQTNSAIPFAERFMLKIYRQVEVGTNSELEVGEYLNEVPGVHVPRVLGGLRYDGPKGEQAIVGLVQELVVNQGTAWEMTMQRVGAYFDRVLSENDEAPVAKAESLGRIESAQREIDPEWHDRIGPYLDEARLMGKRTAEVHLALARPSELPAFAPEPFTIMHQQSIYQRTRGLLVRTFAALRKRLPGLADELRRDVEELAMREKEIEQLLRRVTARKIDGMRIRCHGDLHLGQILHTGDDFVLIDFEGEPGRPINERSYKRCPLGDVMGMVRSFSYATESVIRSGRYRDRDFEQLRGWSRVWETHVSSAYLSGYLDLALGGSFLPKSAADIELMLSFYGIEKGIYEIAYELNNRPDWLPIPVAGLSRMIDAEAARA